MSNSGNVYHKLIISELMAGREWPMAKFYGNSMLPLVKSGEPVRLVPATGDLEIGDIVFCQVQGRLLLHKITARRDSPRGYSYQISNNRGRVNGWTSTIYGKVVR